MIGRPHPARWSVRIRPAPAHDPPYDEERPSGWSAPDAVQPLLELPGIPGAEPPRPGRTGSDRRPDQAWPDQAPADQPPPGIAGASPATTAAAARFVNTCLEILNGYRPVTHFRALSSPLAAANVLEAMTHAVRKLRPVARRDGLVKLRAMRTCEPRPGVAEIALVVAVGLGHRAGGPPTRPDRPLGRAWGLAYRLELQHGRWHCTAARLL